MIRIYFLIQLNFGIVLLLLFSHSIYASNTLSTQISLKAGIESFHYQEFQNKNVLLSEHGNLSSTQISLASKVGFTRLASNFNISKGNVEYSGQTQLGAPLKTQTNQKITNINLKIFFPLTQAHELGLGASKSVWQRRILPTEFSQQLNEEYHWHSLDLLITRSFNLSKTLTVRINGELNRILNSKVDIDLRNVSNSIERLEMGPSLGIQGELDLVKKITNNVSLLISYKIDKYKFNKSDSKSITINRNLFSIHEPASKTTNQYLSAGFKYQF